MEMVADNTNLNNLDLEKYQSLDATDYLYRLVESVDDIRGELDYLTTFDSNRYFTCQYYKAIELAPPSGISCLYVILLREGLPVAFHYFQYKKVSLKESLGLRTMSEFSWKAIQNQIKMTIASWFDAHILVSGNLSLTGENGNLIVDKPDAKTYGDIIDSILANVITHLKTKGIDVAAILVKDFFEDSCPELPKEYTKFSVQPNMVVTNMDRWDTMEDYLSDLRSKYRVRYKKARKSIHDIEKRALTLEEIDMYMDKMDAMYKQISNSASFNMFTLPRTYFYNLKQCMQENFHVIGYFKEQELLAFYTYAVQDEEIDAHFLGYDGAVNQSKKLYLNILYDMVETAIILSKKRLTLSRTAMEIKSTIGAEGVDMKVFFKIINPLLNRLFVRALGYFNPTEDFVLRSPFKK